MGLERLSKGDAQKAPPPLSRRKSRGSRRNGSEGRWQLTVMLGNTVATVGWCDFWDYEIDRDKKSHRSLAVVFGYPAATATHLRTAYCVL